MMTYNKYLLLASAIIIGLMTLGVMILPLLFVALPFIAIIVLCFLFTAKVTITTEDNNTLKD